MRPNEPDPADQPLFRPQGGGVSLPGDLRAIGPHRFLCARPDEHAYAGLLGDRKARMVFVDPPYNVPIDGQ
jgi:hypothetical protein